MKIVFDVGGTNMRIAASRGTTLEDEHVTKTPARAQDAVELLVAKAQEFARGEKIESIVGGIAGVIKNGRVEHSQNLRGWEEADVKKELTAAFPGAKVEVYNDALLGALGEARRGAGRGKEVVGYMTVGTGIGGARVAGGKLGEHPRGYEPGKHILDETLHKTFEDIASGPALEARYGPWDKTTLSEDELKEIAKILADGVYNAISHWSPDVMVLGGGVLLKQKRMVPLIAEVLQTMGNDVPIPPILPAELGDKSVLYGALEA